MSRVTVKPEILRWARERADRSVESLRIRFPKYELWERGEAAPTLKQLEAFARATYVPIGYLFLPQPPEEHVPIPDLRTVASRRLEQPTPDLLDTIYLCRQRQVWYRDYARSVGDQRQEPALRPRLLSGLLGMARHEERHRAVVQYREGGRRGSGYRR